MKRKSNRNHWLRVRITEREDRLISRAARRAGVTRSEYVRNVLMDHIVNHFR